MPNTRPGIYFDDEGVCQACRAEEKKDVIDWGARWNELETLCEKHRGKYGKNAPDCMIAVSGGKDSHVQVHTLKEKLGMNPMLVSVEDNFTMTEVGKANLQNISETFGCNIISLKPNIRAQKALMRLCFEKWAKPTWFIDRLIYTYPLHMAKQFGLPFLIYGENINYEYGGKDRVETPSAMAQVENGVASDITFADLAEAGVTEQDLYFCTPPSELEMLEPTYLSYFIRWSSYKNYVQAKALGLQDLTHEWRREHTFEDIDQVDSYAYLVHPWLKYPKFGHASATDYASKFIRYGLIEREEGIRKVKQYDHKVDQKAVADFCNFAGYTLREFYSIVDGFYNRELFEKDKHGQWVLKNPIWEK